MNVGVVGATGLVGRTMVRVIEERAFPLDRLRLFASERSAGSTIPFRGKDIVVEKLEPRSFEGIDIALFSAGGGLSREFAPIAAAAGAIVIDNSSAWRQDPDVPLVVPEVNGSTAHEHKGIIANPNCSTIQLLLPLQSLHDRFGLRRVVVSTYQSISGAGQSGVEQLQTEMRGETPAQPHFRRPAALNTMFHDFPEGSEETEEEMKMVRESRRILGLPELRIAVTCVRIPTTGGHGESVNVELERPTTVEEIRAALSEMEGMRVVDDPSHDVYPTILDAEGIDDVLVGRIRADRSVENGFHLWVVADNLRKGAATNAVQIAELIAKEIASTKTTS